MLFFSALVAEREAVHESGQFASFCLVWQCFCLFFLPPPRKVCAWLMFMNCFHKTSMLNTACIASSRYAHKKQQPQMHGLLIEIQKSSLAVPLVLESVDSSTCKCTWAASAALELWSSCGFLWLCVTCRQCNSKQLPYHYILLVSEKQPVIASVLNYRPHKIVHVSGLPRAFRSCYCSHVGTCSQNKPLG